MFLIMWLLIIYNRAPIFINGHYYKVTGFPLPWKVWLSQRIEEVEVKLRSLNFVDGIYVTVAVISLQARSMASYF